MTSMPTANPKLMEHRIIRTRGQNPYNTCNNCSHKFKNGDERHEWRLHTTSLHYGSGMYWTTNCEKCFVENIVKWRDALTEEIENLPQYVGELSQ